VRTLLLLSLLCGCSTTQADVLTVYAAASLTETMEDLESAFEAEHPGIDVQVALAGTQVLRLQIEQGAPADVFLAANPDHMAALDGAGLVDDRGVFAVNRLVVAVSEDSPIRAFDQLPRAERLVIGAPTSPIGAYTDRALDASGEVLGPEFVQAVRGHVVSRESNVRLVRTKVAMGEADAAIVYRTDLVGIDGLRAVDVPAAVDPGAQLLAGRVVATDAPELADAFLGLLTGPTGRAVLERHGFGAP